MNEYLTHLQQVTQMKSGSGQVVKEVRFLSLMSHTNNIFVAVNQLAIAILHIWGVTVDRVVVRR